LKSLFRGFDHIVFDVMGEQALRVAAVVASSTCGLLGCVQLCHMTQGKSK
jgi:hypothetical protein